MILHGDCLELMKNYPDNHFSAIVTDPPYGLSFMGKKWDRGVPDISFWSECLRVAVPGSFLLAMGGTRTYHHLTCAIEGAGWEIRDCLMWIYGSGFPKSHNHFGIEGYGTSLKPAYEPIIMAMKPCDGTFANNAEKWGQAGINIDACRIGLDGATKRNCQSGYPKNANGTEDRSVHWARTGREVEIVNKGRWPANVIFDEEAGAILDEQSGVTRSSTAQRNNSPEKNRCLSGDNLGLISHGHNDSGGASRFFYCPKASSRERNEGLEGWPLKEKKTLNEYVNPSEGRTANKSGGPMANNHPTVKPLKLMEYLIKLVMPPKDGLLLDPFAGSGTTILAAKNLGYAAIGMEKSEEYCRIANERLKGVTKEGKQEQMSLFKKAM